MVNNLKEYNNNRKEISKLKKGKQKDYKSRNFPKSPNLQQTRDILIELRNNPLQKIRANLKESDYFKNLAIIKQFPNFKPEKYTKKSVENAIEKIKTTESGAEIKFKYINRSADKIEREKPKFLELKTLRARLDVGKKIKGKIGIKKILMNIGIFDREIKILTIIQQFIDNLHGDEYVIVYDIEITPAKIVKIYNPLTVPIRRSDASRLKFFNEKNELIVKNVNSVDNMCIPDLLENLFKGKGGYAKLSRNQICDELNEYWIDSK